MVTTQGSEILGSQYSGLRGSNQMTQGFGQP